MWLQWRLRATLTPHDTVSWPYDHSASHSVQNMSSCVLTIPPHPLHACHLLPATCSAACLCGLWIRVHQSWQGQRTPSLPHGPHGEIMNPKWARRTQKTSEHIINKKSDHTPSVMFLDTGSHWHTKISDKISNKSVREIHTHAGTHT